ncbi:MAG TPA: hypothetical protein VME01_07065 [Solirubrobacteraceae bacterium]|nr:hypothetical protein [Solirubrobacteraceae bacterium]
MERDEQIREEEVFEVEILDGEVVEHTTSLESIHVEERSLTWGSPQMLQTAAVAATGFVAGAATLALLRRYSQARVERAAAAQQAEPQAPRRGRTYIVQVRQVTTYSD